MTDSQLSALLEDLLRLPNETDWVEFKENVTEPDMIGKRLSGLSNAAALAGRSTGYMVWGVEDGTHAVTGTTFKPLKAKKGGEALINWLLRMVTPNIDFHFREWLHQGKAMVFLEIPAASHQPISFSGTEYIRIDSHTKALKEFPERERALWAMFSKRPFEQGIAKTDLAAEEVVSLIDFAGCFDLLKIALPTDTKGILSRLADEKLIESKPGGRFDITNMGAMLFAKSLAPFDRLSRKALRIIKYRGPGRIDTEREWRDPPSQRGYALAFEAAVAFINSQLPQNEPIGQAFRTEVRMYPEKAIRELVANALVHQDFSVTGAGPMVEIFSDRMEITNSGEPLVETLRFIDTPPRSRNEGLAAMMRRMSICEEGGTGIDKVVAAVEAYQLPAPDFVAITTMNPGSTKATLYSHRKLSEMDAKDRIRACYQHACLSLVSGGMMTNSSLRKRFAIEEHNAAKASRIIAETIASKLIKQFDPTTSNRYMKYVPFWA
jgi:ATP-dependent DNA helicase RecG